MVGWGKKIKHAETDTKVLTPARIGGMRVNTSSFFSPSQLSRVIHPNNPKLDQIIARIEINIDRATMFNPTFNTHKHCRYNLLIWCLRRGISSSFWFLKIPNEKWTRNGSWNHREAPSFLATSEIRTHNPEHFRASSLILLILMILDNASMCLGH